MGPIVARLKAIREKAGLTGEELGPRLGWADHSQLSKVERGQKTTDVWKIEKWIEECAHDVYIVSRDAPTLDDARALLAALPDDRRELALRVARLLERMDAAEVDRLRNDVEYLESRKGLRLR